MSAVIPILAIIFPFIVIIVIADNIHEEKIKKMKIEAALREAEMEKGYAPGTYSRSFSSKAAYKEFERQAKRDRKNRKRDPEAFEKSPFNEKEEREALEKGIKNLQERIDNIETIMKDKARRNKEGEGERI